MRLGKQELTASGILEQVFRISQDQEHIISVLCDCLEKLVCALCSLNEDNREEGKQEHRLKVHLQPHSNDLFPNSTCLGLVSWPLSALCLLGESVW